MILLREVQEKDLDALERMAQIPGFINLLPDKDLLRERIARSVASFQGKIRQKSEAKYIFVAEDLKTGRVVGTSMIAGQHGSAESPHFYFQVGNEEKFSETINTGFIHGTLELKYDTDGPSEIGGLVIDPEFRNSESRIGRQISFVRFLYLGLHRDRFKDKLLAELLPPLNKRGQSPLWEAIGRRFTNMDYWEADQLCQKNKEFIFSLFPTGKIYTSFLTAEARNAIGKVGKETEPVLHMLKKIGFRYTQNVDPFDGGPHLWADAKDLLPIQNLAFATFEQAEEGSGGASSVSQTEGEYGLLSKEKQPSGQFRAVTVRALLAGGKLRILGSQGEEKALGLSDGDRVAFMRYY